jgi:serine/threonine-protein kinase TTK/MPS1
MAAFSPIRITCLSFCHEDSQQMLKAVHSIHEECIIHGDLKPANFLFVRGSLKLIDFGIAKAIQSDDTTNIYRESRIGTLNYMSPEALFSETSSQGQQWRCGRVRTLAMSLPAPLYLNVAC